MNNTISLLEAAHAAPRSAELITVGVDKDTSMARNYVIYVGTFYCCSSSSASDRRHLYGEILCGIRVKIKLACCFYCLSCFSSDRSGEKMFYFLL